MQVNKNHIDRHARNHTKRYTILHMFPIVTHTISLTVNQVIHVSHVLLISKYFYRILLILKPAGLFYAPGEKCKDKRTALIKAVIFTTPNNNALTVNEESLQPPHMLLFITDKLKKQDLILLVLLLIYVLCS